MGGLVGHRALVSSLKNEIIFDLQEVKTPLFFGPTATGDVPAQEPPLITVQGS
jgi:hypothetical protein